MLVLTLAGCENSDPGLKNLTVELVAQTTPSKISSGGRIGTQGDTVIFDSFLLGVTEISLKGKEWGQGKCMNDSDDEDENHDGDSESDDDGYTNKNKWETEGEFVVDLINKTSTPEISGTWPTDSITFRKMEIEFGPVLPDGNSVYVKATVTQAGESYEVEFATSRQFEIHLKRKHGIELNQALDKLLVAFSVNRLFAYIDWSAAVADADGVIRIQNPANAGIAAKVKFNFMSLMKWGHDKNHDHRLDDHDD